MVSRRLAAWIFLSASLLVPTRVFAGPSLTPSVLQCDGSYLGGTNPLATRAPSPVVRVSAIDSTGLRVGRWPMGVLPNSTNVLWRFDNTSNNVTIARVLSGASCIAQYSYQEASYSNLNIGACYYQGTSNPCSWGTVVSSVTGAPTQIPLGLSACPASPPAAGATTLFNPSSNFSYANNAAATFVSTASQFGAISYASGQWYDLDKNYTISAWIRFTGAGPQRLISEEGSAGIWAIGFGTNSASGVDGGLRSVDSRDTAAGTPDKTLGGGYNDGNWHQVHIVRRDGIDRRFYVDGKLIGTVVAVSSDSFSGHPIKTAVYLGAANGAGEYFNGQIDELREITGAISDDDVLLEYLGTVHKYSADGGVTYSTAPGSFLGGTPSNGVQTAVTYLPGETATSSSLWVFEAQSTQTLSTVLTPISVTIDRSSPTAPAPSGSPTTTNDITWSWGTPSRFCPPPGSALVYYQLADAVTGSVLNPPGAIVYPASSIAEHASGSPNQLLSRRLLLTDAWGTSPLSASASAYTLAASPISPAVASVSTGGFVFSWNASANPSYTRYEVTWTQDPAFVSGVSTRAAYADGYTATSIGFTGLNAGNTYYVRVRAFNGRSSDFSGGSPTTSSSTSVVTTPTSSVLAATALSSTAIRWDWTQVVGASIYGLYDSPTQSSLFSGAALTFTTSTLTPNTRYDAEVEADAPPPAPGGARAHAFTYTQANPPLSPIVAVYGTSATFSWNANGNPAGTFYQVVLGADPAYSVIVATLSVTTTTAVASSLLPGAAYYAKVQAISGAQAPTGFVSIGAVATTADPAIASSSAPATPYAASSGLVGSWQFDEGAGSTAADSSGNGNTVSFSCVSAGCSSTPTFAAGPAGLGTSASFSGLAGVALTGSGVPFNVSGSVTVEAWVNPQTSAQMPGAGVVAIGAQNAEDFALDVGPGGSFRFLTSNGGAEIPVTVATATIAAGQWMHVVGVYDAARASATLYLNGRAAAVVGGVPARSNSGQVLSIGNRQNALGAYGLPFFGRIDAVRVSTRALSAAEVLADYQGGFVSSVTAAGSAVILALPPNAFGAPAQIYVSTDPVNHPIRVSPATLSAGLSAAPAGMTLAPGTLVEIVPIVGGTPFTSTLGSSATLSIAYADADGNGLVDGTRPPLPVSSLRLYTLNTTVNRWDALPSAVDLADKRVTGTTPHFSIFALFAAATVGQDLSGARVYPIPWKPGSGGRFDAAGVTFDGLPSSGRIRILSLAGRRVRELTFNGASAGRAVWDGANNDGRRAASGVYFARIESDADGKSVILKFAVER